MAAHGAGRLTGTVIGVSSMPSPPLSVEGHAHRLIDEAVCKERLGKMYIWCVAGRLRKLELYPMLHSRLLHSVRAMVRPVNVTDALAHRLAFCA